jgi:hypothetical protein
MTKEFSQALAAAREYEGLIAQGRVEEAGQVRRTIDLLVGKWIDGVSGTRVWGWPACVVAVARGSARTDLPGYVPASEVQS